MRPKLYKDAPSENDERSGEEQRERESFGIILLRGHAGRAKRQSFVIIIPYKSH
jgi:hypothetical protein